MLFDQDWTLQLIIIGQIVLAMILGGLIGFERELANKPAGFRTHTLVAGASAAFMGIAAATVNHFHPELGVRGVAEDLLRIPAAIITGVSFLGAGTIFREVGSGKIGGLTTAATIWVAAAVGITTAAGQLLVAFALTVVALTVLRGMKWLERIESSK
ncbi:MAG TPA: MgtC/SapB family protein [Gammaproteobacteria bacterium]